jgi:hypothetical protein
MRENYETIPVPRAVQKSVQKEKKKKKKHNTSDKSDHRKQWMLKQNIKI